MEKKRCGWCEGNALYTKYHDQEWGVPSFNDKILFEFLILETFQVGLSWITILKKRNNFKKSFDYFDYNKISKYNFKNERKLLRYFDKNQVQISFPTKNDFGEMSKEEIKEWGKNTLYE